MPRGQSFVLKNLADDQIKDYVSSDLVLGTQTYLDLDPESSLTLPFIGSQNYFEGLNIWIFEPSFASFLNYEYGTEMTESFGQFFMRKSEFMPKETLKENT
jgi:hypothetical protein